MKTIEELQAMAQGELVAYAQKLQSDLEESKKSLTYCINEKMKIESKFDSLRGALKSLSVLAD